MEERLDRLGITPIIDLCHFGLPAWARGFQDPDWPEKFAEYAAAFAQEFKSVLLYTPINEIYVAANFSGQLENWNERTGSDRGFVRALCNLCRANVRAMEEILKVQSGAVFIQSESSEYFHPETEKDVPAAQFLNSKRFLSLDLSYGRAVDSEVLLYLERNGMPEQDYHFFMKRRDDVLQSCVMGNDYYYTNEHWVDGAKHSNPFHYRHAGEIFGYYVITHQYYERYRMPLMHTETNRASVGSGPDESSDWLQKEWANVLQLKQDGVPIIGFTWYGLVDLVGWDGLLCGDDMKPVRAGLCTLSRAKRRVGTRYRELIRSWRDALRAPQIGTTPAGRPVDVDLVAQQVKSLQRGTFKRGGLRVR